MKKLLINFAIITILVSGCSLNYDTEAMRVHNDLAKYLGQNYKDLKNFVEDNSNDLDYKDYVGVPIAIGINTGIVIEINDKSDINLITLRDPESSSVNNKYNIEGVSLGMNSEEAKEILEKLEEEPEIQVSEDKIEYDYEYDNKELIVEISKNNNTVSTISLLYTK